MTTIAKTPTEIEADVLGRFTTLTGKTLLAADPRRLLLQSVIYYLSHLRSLVELADKRNLPGTVADPGADGTALDALGTFVGAARSPGEASVTTAQYTRTSTLVPLVVPEGHRVTTSDGSYTWETTEALTLGVGVASGTVSVRCTVTGPESNDLPPGTITVLVDPLAGVTVTNTTTTAGGVDEQTDDEFRPSVIAAPEGFTTCGPRSAYEWYAKDADSRVLDAAALGPDDDDTRAPSAGEVAVYLLIDSEDVYVIDEVLTLVEDALSEDTVRPLTDSVSVEEAVEVSYTVEVSYYIPTSQAGSVTAIQAAVEAAQDAYCDWQEAALGRDVDPTELVGLLYAAGARRIAVTSPTFQAVQRSERALRDSYVVAPTYLGLSE